ncbi:hypothetical protein IB286_15310 [Spongiibacter sp. KMU-158]|uniref:START domain-containing protein n=1 Tax=Spongiibacter pelagi TaxID=2760804 RepID=A0A927GXB7_9GAMM|nr:START domain-containing protein [Spongiibacter pelagi]MBD2860360.1 hypothetical protein [Spongiibacter pelagi]
MNRIALVSLVFLCGFTGLVSASDADWRLDKDKDGIKIYTRKIEGSDIRQIRGTVEIKGRLSSVIALLQDPEYLAKANPLIAEAYVQERFSETESLFYLELDMPWPVTDRYGLLRRKIQQDPGTKVVTFTEVATTDDMPEKKGYIRIVQSKQQWILTPNADGSVSLDTTSHTDPNGPIPAAVLNWISVVPTYDFVDKLREEIEAGGYADAELSFIQEP